MASPPVMVVGTAIATAGRDICVEEG